MRPAGPDGGHASASPGRPSPAGEGAWPPASLPIACGADEARTFQSAATLAALGTLKTAVASDNAGVGAAQNFVTIDFSPRAQPFPPYATAVFVIRVK